MIGLAAALTPGLAVAPRAAEAQQARTVPRIGYISPASPGRFAEAFRQGMRELRYIEGQNIVIEWKFAEGQDDRLPSLATELVRANVAVIVTDGDLATRAVRGATRNIPVVLAASADPIDTQDVVSLARPGGNVGLSQITNRFNATFLSDVDLKFTTSNEEGLRGDGRAAGQIPPEARGMKSDRARAGERPWSV